MSALPSPRFAPSAFGEWPLGRLLVGFYSPPRRRILTAPGGDYRIVNCLVFDGRSGGVASADGVGYVLKLGLFVHILSSTSTFSTTAVLFVS